VNKRFLTLATAALLIFISLVLPPGRVSAADEVDLIVNKANTISDLSLADAKKIFMGDKTTWPSGKRVSVLMAAAGSPERAVVLREIFKMSDAEYTKYFMQAAFTGKVTAPPKDMSSASQMKTTVAGNPGAVGYVMKADADDTVKVVLKIP
jgi:ABC-type phosphate transport system substrate-binding protein